MPKEFTLKDLSTTVVCKKKEGDKPKKFKIEYKNKESNDKINVDNNEGKKTIQAKVTEIVEGKDDNVLGENVNVDVSYDKDG